MLTSDDVKQLAHAVVKDPASSTEEKRNARQAITRINSTRAHRAKKPSRKNFSSDAEYREAVESHRAVLDRLAIEKECGRTLDSHGSTPLQRHNARKKLEALNGPPPDEVQPESDEKKASDAPRREDFGFQSGHEWPEFVASGKEVEFQAALTKWCETAAPPTDPKVAKFFNWLDDSSRR